LHQGLCYDGSLERTTMCIVTKNVRWFSARCAPCHAALLASLLILLPWSVTGQQAATPPDAAEAATVHGVVLSTVDKKPIPRALVTLGNSDRSVLTDDNGRFTFADVPFGLENASARKPGFQCPRRQSANVPKCVQNVEVMARDVEVSLAIEPQSVVTGRIVDQAGEPAAHLPLFLMRRTIVNGLFDWEVPAATSATTHEDGAFRIANLEPGTYLLRTASMADSEIGRKDTDRGFPATFYPGTSEQSAARPLVIHAGEEFKADFVVRHEQFEPVVLSLARNHSGTSGGIGWCLSGKTPKDELFSAMDSSRNELRLFAPTGDYKVTFTVNLPADPKTARPMAWPDGTKLPYLGSVEFAVKDQPVTVTEIPTQQSVTIPLHVRAMLTEQEKRKAAAERDGIYSPPSVTITLSDHGLEFDSDKRWSADKDLTDFKFEKVSPGRFVVAASTYRDVYIASLTCGSTNLLREPLTVGSGVTGCSIEAVVRDDMASLTVGLTPKATAQMTAAGITVTDLALIPVENAMEQPYSAAVWRDGAPRAARISPGTYLAFLFDGRAIAWRDPDVRKQLMSLGTLICVAPGESKTVLLDWKTELNAGEPIGVSLGRVIP
jgi:hypothetical protein